MANDDWYFMVNDSGTGGSPPIQPWNSRSDGTGEIHKFFAATL